MKSGTLFLLVAAVTLFSGCYTPQVYSATTIECRVYDEVSGAPIPNASVYLIYEGMSRSVEKGPFFTNEQGVGIIRTEGDVVWQPAGDSFGGGFMRRIAVRVVGYENTSFTENLNRGLLEKKSPHTFKLKRWSRESNQSIQRIRASHAYLAYGHSPLEPLL